MRPVSTTALAAALLGFITSIPSSSSSIFATASSLGASAPIADALHHRQPRHDGPLTPNARHLESYLDSRAPVAPIAGMKAAPLEGRVGKRDASTVMSIGSGNTEGEDHSPIVAPRGSVFTSIQVQHRTRIGAFWTASPNNDTAEQAFVMIHGKMRDGGDYWTTMNNILASAVEDGYNGASSDSIVVAPQFFSTILNSGQYDDNMMAWPDTNAWQAGDPANHPSTTDQTSFDALDAFVDEFSDMSKYPSMKNLTFVGHGGGAQLIARYAMVAKDVPCNLHVRYISGDPSSNPYFTADRPLNTSAPNAVADCPWYNTWRYGFDNFTGTSEGLFSPQQYFQRYVQRDYVSIVGLLDVDADGDQYCMAQMQGGVRRRDRNLCWWQYINALAGTDEELSAFPCQFGDLPDWSNMTGNVLGPRLSVVADADHDAEMVYSSEQGRSALFSSADVLIGWRPEGWRAATGQITPGVVSCDAASTGSSTGSASTATATVRSTGAATDGVSAGASSAGSSVHSSIGLATLLLVMFGSSIFLIASALL